MGCPVWAIRVEGKATGLQPVDQMYYIKSPEMPTAEQVASWYHSDYGDEYDAHLCWAIEIVEVGL